MNKLKRLGMLRYNTIKWDNENVKYWRYEYNNFQHVVTDILLN